jgi:hypothetical protein
MRRRFFSRAGWVTAELREADGRWTATLVGEHPTLSRLGGIPGRDPRAAIANLKTAIGMLFVRSGNARSADGWWSR